MICKICNVHMISGTSYEMGISRRFDECPKCHFRKYNKGINMQESRIENKNKKKKYKCKKI